MAMSCEDAAHTYESLIQSFEYFGGVTAEVLVDNQKTEVISHRGGGAVEYNTHFLELAAHYGFQPRACRPRPARSKGNDERMARYIKEKLLLRALPHIRKSDASTNWRRSGCARKPTSGCTGRPRKLLGSASRARRPWSYPFWYPNRKLVRSKFLVHLESFRFTVFRPFFTAGGWSKNCQVLGPRPRAVCR